MKNIEKFTLEYLGEIIKNIPSKSDNIQIPQKDLMKELRKFVRDDDPQNKWDDLEKYISYNTFTIDDWFASYDHYSKFLRLKPISTIQEIDFAEEKREKNLDKIISKQIYNLNSVQFESFLAELFRKISGFINVHPTQPTNDGGIDFAGQYWDKNLDVITPLYGQAKLWKLPNKATEPDLTKFSGTLSHKSKGKPITGIFVCTSGFSDKAKNVRCNYTIKFYDLNDIITLMKSYEIGLKIYQPKFTVMDGNFWDEIRS